MLKGKTFDQPREDTTEIKIVKCNLKKKVLDIDEHANLQKSANFLAKTGTYCQVLSYGLHLFASIDVLLVGFPMGFHCLQGFSQHLQKSITHADKQTRICQCRVYIKMQSKFRELAHHR